MLIFIINIYLSCILPLTQGFLLSMFAEKYFDFTVDFTVFFIVEAAWEVQGSSLFWFTCRSQLHVQMWDHAAYICPERQH